MKLPELIQNVKSTLYNNRVPNTHLLDNRQIIYWINEQRALWLKREYNQVRPPMQNEKQVLENIELEIVDDEDIIDINNYTLLKSKKKLPRTIQYNISDGVSYVSGTKMLSKKINYTTKNNMLYKGNGIFNRKQIFAFKDNDYLWIKYGHNMDKSRILKYVKLQGIFENPLEVDIFNDNDNSIRFGLSEYPVSESFLPFIETEILKTHQNFFIKDISSNDEEDKNLR